MYRRIFFSFIILSVSIFASAQELEWNVDANGFFDNMELSSKHRNDGTLTGFWIEPKVGIRDSVHALRVGYGAVNCWGGEKMFNNETLTLYYMYDGAPFRVLVGAFPREELYGNFPTCIFSDSLRYYNKNVQGALFQYGTDKGYVEALLDWTGQIGHNRHEQFLAGLSARLNMGHAYMGVQGYYYHYALTLDAPADMHIQDYSISNGFLGYDFTEQTSLDSLSVQCGVLFGMERDRRGKTLDWNLRPGILFEATLGLKCLYLKETFYCGKRQQIQGDLGINRWYWNDPYYRSKIYNRVDALYRFAHGRGFEGYIGAVAHFDGDVIDWQQQIKVSVSLGNMKQHKRKLLRNVKKNAFSDRKIKL